MAVMATLLAQRLGFEKDATAPVTPTCKAGAEASAWERQPSPETPATACSSGTSSPRPDSPEKQGLGRLALGACPIAAFPNDHLKVPCTARWAAPKTCPPTAMLREVLQTADWESLFAEGRTLSKADATWAASEERAQLLQALCSLSKAQRVLEVGSFVGLASVAMAEVLPEGGQVVSLEIDPFLADMGRRACAAASQTGRRVCQVIGPARESLKALAAQATAGEGHPFDFVLLDADKAGTAEYLQILWSSPGLLAERATVCVNVAVQEEKNPSRFARFGVVQPRATADKEVAALRASLLASEEFLVREVGGMMVMVRRT